MKDFYAESSTWGKQLYNLLISYTFFSPVLRHNSSCRKSLLLPLYANLSKNRDNNPPNQKKTVIYMVLKETTFSGGLSDRFRAITSIYAECKKQGVPFKIYFSTLKLTDYLLPNQYDWTIDENEICYDTKKVYPCTLLTYHSNLKNLIQCWSQKIILRYYLKKKYQQIHLYSNMVTQDNHYGELFHELFKPSELLLSQLNLRLQEIGGKQTYIAMVFRFRQLLGDFKEGGETLPLQEREAYINRCVMTVQQQHQKHQNKRILVTSDSTTFLNAIQKLPFVYTIPGEVVHISFSFNADKMTYMKSFIDYYMLSFANRVILVRDAKMYHSGFALRAALLNNCLYEETQLLPTNVTD